MSVEKCVNCFCLVEIFTFLLPGAFEYYSLILTKSFLWKSLLQIATMTLSDYSFVLPCRIGFIIFIIKCEWTIGFLCISKFYSTK